MYGQITGQLGVLGSSKIDPIVSDTCYDEPLAYQNFPASPFVVVLSDELDNTTEFIRFVLNYPTLSGVAADSLLVHGPDGITTVTASEALKRLIPADDEMKHTVVQVISSMIPLIQKVSILCCSIDTVNSKAYLLASACGVFGIIKSTGGSFHVSKNMQRFLDTSRQVHSKLRLVLLMDLLDQSGLRSIPRMVWALSRSYRIPESPLFHICSLDGFGREDVEKDILTLPLRAVLQRVVEIGNDAKRVRCHAAIVSYLKSQLPVFNRETKQAELASNIFQLIPVIARKFAIPLADFNTLRIDQLKIARLDFSKIKKIRDFESISDVINQDIPKLLSVIPHTDTDLMELGWCTTAPSLPTRGQSFNIALYVDDFNAMNPTDGTLPGDEKIKSHLTSLAGPNVESRTLHRIWRLADKDADGRLSLPEYAICRDLIEFAKQGNEVPKNL